MSEFHAYGALLKYAYVAALVGVAAVLRYLLRPILDPLRTIPGPFLARFSRLWQLGVLHRGDLEHVTIDLHRRHGKSSEMSSSLVQGHE
jgi:hypothetical protein